jgi:hypothetical protein
MSSRTLELCQGVCIRLCILALACAASTAGSAAEGFEQHGVHEHGKITFNIALEGSTLSIELDGPADNVVGFEHAPRTDAERKIVTDMAAMLKSGRDLFVFPPAAACKFMATELKAPQWSNGNGHADYEATFTYHCEQPKSLAWVQLQLLPRLHQIHEAQVNILVGTRQASETVKSAKTRVRLL